MGTNIYVQVPGCPDACEHCAQARQVHLGKFSAGWPFTFAAPAIEDGRDCDDLYDEWLTLAKSGPITTEYGTPCDLDALLQQIDHRRHEPGARLHGDPGIVRDSQGRRWLAGEFS